MTQKQLQEQEVRTMVKNMLIVHDGIMKGLKEKSFCEACQNYVCPEDFVQEAGLCNAHYNDEMMDQAYKHGEPV